MNDTFQSIMSSASLYAPGLPPTQLMDFTARSLQYFWYKRAWSWKKKSATLFPKTFSISASDTCSITADTALLTSTLGSFTPDMINMQVRVGANSNPFPYYTITAWINGFQVVLDRTWAGPTQINSSYYVGQVYFSVPTDFESFVWAAVPAYNYRMDLTVTQSDLALVDAQRSYSGNPVALVPLDYTPFNAGTVGPVTKVTISATSPVPVSTTTLGYNYPTQLTFIIKITTGGLPGGTLQFQWYVPQIATGGTQAVTDNNPIDLVFGAQVYFIQSGYVLNEEFVFTCTPDTTSGVARFEIWPRPQSPAYVIPYQYNLKLPTFDQDNGTLPEPLARRGDSLLKLVKSESCTWPGTETQRNPVYDQRLAAQFKKDADYDIHQMSLLDSDVSKAALRYQNKVMSWPTLSGQYLYNHDVPLYGRGF